MAWGVREKGGRARPGEQRESMVQCSQVIVPDAAGERDTLQRRPRTERNGGHCVGTIASHAMAGCGKKRSSNRDHDNREIGGDSRTMQRATQPLEPLRE